MSQKFCYAYQLNEFKIKGESNDQYTYSNTVYRGSLPFSELQPICDYIEVIEDKSV